jgi:hypothetical protein
MASPIRAEDSSSDKVAKLLPADITAAFLSAKAGLQNFLPQAADSAPYIFWTFVLILVLAPFYFWFASDVRRWFQLTFLCASFVVYAVSIAASDFAVFFAMNGLANAQVVTNVVAIVLPIVWAFIITPTVARYVRPQTPNA